MWQSLPELRSVERWGLPIVEHGRLTHSHHNNGSLRQQGLHVFDIGGIPLDCLVRPAVGQPLFVFLSPLVNRTSDTKLPIFVGQQVAPDKPSVSVLSISDPILIAREDLRVAWYLGLPELDLMTHLVNVISLFREALEAPSVVLVGGSAAGFACSTLVSYFSGVIALIWNPQIDMTRFLPDDVQRYASLFDDTASLVTAPDVLRRYVNTMAGPQRELTKDQALFVLQNGNDQHHMTEHLPLLLSRYGIDRLDQWTWLERNLFVGLGQWGNGHEPLPRSVLKSLLTRLAVNLDEVAPIAFPEVISRFAAELVQDIVGKETREEMNPRGLNMRTRG